MERGPHIDNIRVPFLYRCIICSIVKISLSDRVQQRHLKTLRCIRSLVLQSITEPIWSLPNVTDHFSLFDKSGTWIPKRLSYTWLKPSNRIIVTKLLSRQILVLYSTPRTRLCQTVTWRKWRPGFISVIVAGLDLIALDYNWPSRIANIPEEKAHLLLNASVTKLRCSHQFKLVTYLTENAKDNMDREYVRAHSCSLKQLAYSIPSSAII